MKTDLGTFSVHADTAATSADRAGIERMRGEAARPAFAPKRLRLLPSGKVCYRLRRPYYTCWLPGQTKVVLEPVAFLRRLACLIPPPRQNQIRCYGLLASQAHERPKLEALLPSAEHCDDESESEPAAEQGAQTLAEIAAEDQATSKAVRMSWAKLLARVFAKDVHTCPNCGGHRKIIAQSIEPEPIAKILNHLGLSTEIPAPKSARAPPQIELF